jgi:hypothetical protein
MMKLGEVYCLNKLFVQLLIESVGTLRNVNQLEFELNYLK